MPKTENKKEWGNKLTVGELINQLRQFPQDLPVVIHDGEYAQYWDTISVAQVKWYDGAETVYVYPFADDYFDKDERLVRKATLKMETTDGSLRMSDIENQDRIAMYKQRIAVLEARLAKLSRLDLYRRVPDVDGEFVEPINVVGVHPLRWKDAGHMEPTHGFTPLDWEDVTK
jgi:hypothetical protein